jgi:hypothetical protein
MTEEYIDNNIEDGVAVYDKSKKTSQNKEVLKILETLQSLGFRLSGYRGN